MFHQLSYFSLLATSVTILTLENLCTSYSFFKKYNTNTYTHTRTSNHPYEHTHVYPTRMNTYKRLNRIDFKIHEVGHQERIAIDEDVTSQ
jgi:hypothetical protein